MKEITATGRDVRILACDVAAAKKMYPKSEVVKGDITLPDTLKGVGKDVGTVIHLAGLVSYTKPEEFLRSINADGTRNVLEACKKADRLIFSSSVSVYGEIRGQAADENYPAKPKNAYGRSKLEAEGAILSSGMKGVILRIAPLYGAGSPQWTKNLALLEKGFPIPNTKNLTHVAHVSNAASAFALALKPKARGVYNIADQAPVKFTDFAGELVSLLGRKPSTLPYWFVNSIATMRGMGAYFDVLTMNRSYDITKAKELGYDPSIDFDAELRKMVDWYLKTKQNQKEGVRQKPGKIEKAV
jgi:nucleoside-diphosphate-sugar epimerase